MSPITAPLLAPGEIMKSSGKFAKPTRIPGKNYCKDEVVIRNADSGKGIKYFCGNSGNITYAGVVAKVLHIN